MDVRLLVKIFTIVMAVSMFLASPGAALASPQMPVIDIMVVYTSNAKSAMPDNPYIVVSGPIDDINTSFANSNIFAKARLVSAIQIDYTETGDAGIYLTNLKDIDGSIDEVIKWRDMLGADIVVMLVNSMSNYCGITLPAIRKNDPNGEDDIGNLVIVPDYAYAVVRLDCALNYYTVTHEIGHAFGAGHDNSDGLRAYNFSYGYRDENCQFQTIMSIGCNKETRINYWSNPDIFYEGMTIGSDSINNAKTIEMNAAIVAGFKNRNCETVFLPMVRR